MLELQPGSAITGNVVAFSATDTLRLGGSGAASFDVSHDRPRRAVPGLRHFPEDRQQHLDPDREQRDGDALGHPGRHARGVGRRQSRGGVGRPRFRRRHAAVPDRVRHHPRRHPQCGRRHRRHQRQRCDARRDDRRARRPDQDRRRHAVAVRQQHLCGRHHPAAGHAASRQRPCARHRHADHARLGGVLCVRRDHRQPDHAQFQRHPARGRVRVRDPGRRHLADRRRAAAGEDRQRRADPHRHQHLHRRHHDQRRHAAAWHARHASVRWPDPSPSPPCLPRCRS